MPPFDRENYIGVQERLTQFWSEYPDGRIWTDMKSLPDEWDQVVFFAAVYKHKDDLHPAATGWDAAAKGSGGANNTAWHANCETSAIGRALANMGYAKTSDERASREEMERIVDAPVARSQPRRRDEAPPAVSDADTSPRINQDGLTTLHAAANKRNLNHADVHHLVVARYNLGSTKDLTGKKLAEVMNDLRTLTDEQLADLVLTGMERAKATQSDLGMPTSNAASYRS